MSDKYKNMCPLDHSTYNLFVECDCNFGSAFDVWCFKEQQLAQLQSKLDCAVKALEDLLDKNEVLLSELKSIKSRLVRLHNNDDEKITANNLRAECLVIASLIGYEIEAVNPLNISPSMKRARLALEEIKK